MDHAGDGLLPGPMSYLLDDIFEAQRECNT
jgi:hypothetical protein